jgi:3-oxoacyl-[acyl-carrier-protein] synthase III
VPLTLQHDLGPIGARVAGIGGAVPDTVVRAPELTERFGKTAEWLRQRTGITELRRLRDGEDLLEQATTAAQAALDDAAMGADEIDLLIVASCSQSACDGPLSLRLAARIAPHAVAFDLNAACAGFCYALSTARTLIMQGSAKRVLVVGAEQMSRIVDPQDMGTSILFGDGAGAAVVVADALRADAISPAAWSSEGESAHLLVVPPGGRYLRMNGPEVFRWAVDRVHHVAQLACERAGVEPRDIDVFVPHQANLRIVDAMAIKLGLASKVIATDVVTAGNTSAASIPLALTALRRAGRTRSGQRALLVGFGAGLAVCAQVIRLP